MSLPIANCRLAMGICKTPVVFAEEGCLLSLALDTIGNWQSGTALLSYKSVTRGD